MTMERVKTRNCVWDAKRLFKVARKFARQVLRENAKMRKAKRNCPYCKFDMLLCNGYSLWCISCGLMVPADSIRSVKTGRKVKF